MAMKESGIEWVGLIPDDWKIAKNNRLFNISKQLINENWKNTQLLSLTKSGIIEKNINDGGGKQPESFGTYQYVEKDDIVLCLFDIDVSAVFSDRSKYDGMISPAYRVMKCTDAILPVYAKWWFDAVNIGRYYLIYTKSLRKTIDADGFGNILTVVPPLSEQEAIADYLDKTCSKIDEIIAEAKASIDEYKNFRQSVISEAVLNGIEQHNYKNVDLEWIASIPDTWGVLPLKRYFTYQKGLPITKADLLENGDKVISYGQIHAKFNTGVTVDERLIRYVSHEYSLSNSESLCSKGDIILADTSEDKDGCGNAVYIDTDEMIFAGYHTIILKSNVDNKYLAYLFTSDTWRSQIRKRVQGVKLFSVTLKILNQCSIILPPVNEQIDIVKYLDKKTAIIDACISEKESLINDLEAYKKSLIYEVVTGKRRVV